MMTMEREHYDMVKQSMNRVYEISRQENPAQFIDSRFWLDVGILCGFALNALPHAEISEIDPAEILRNLK